MAGGRGTRLQPLTNDMPKPMLKVGGKPILETIISRFVDQGFCKIFLSVNYRAEIIQDYFIYKLDNLSCSKIVILRAFFSNALRGIRIGRNIIPTNVRLTSLNSFWLFLTK